MRESNNGRAAVWQAGRFTWNLSERALVMGILNVTPDSFSDGGSYRSMDAALKHAHSMVAQGADILDIGGESTRPGSLSVSVEDELSRTIPVIQRICSQIDVAISIDTSKPEVAKAALNAGAAIINDVTGFQNPEMRSLCAQTSCGMVAMHMQGTPETMQDSPDYRDVVVEVGSYFTSLSEDLVAQGIHPERVVYDPGIGFGKSLAHNLTLLRGLSSLRLLGRPLLMGISRKSLIASLLEKPGIENREFPTVALTAFTRMNGAVIHRVHTVDQNVAALEMVAALGV
ncbi:dihydropteroate synthase [bacterium]|nr:dihydropteroate synthase [Akkermansiaceae bacterium]MDA8972835.1 dihydropteroate synthase [bacterium]MDA7538160.1 dihydropteroate synthase [Akkermansiaceae bacterium]MDA7863505.1 dihydropteroate synthase [Akkermansiaceae bacterium]MDA8980618.1 dihydropteroate synthase [bacterium]